MQTSTLHISDSLYQTSAYLRDIRECFRTTYSPQLNESHFEHLMCIVSADGSYLTYVNTFMDFAESSFLQLSKYQKFIFSRNLLNYDLARITYFSSVFQLRN